MNTPILLRERRRRLSPFLQIEFTKILSDSKGHMTKTDVIASNSSAIHALLNKNIKHIGHAVSLVNFLFLTCLFTYCLRFLIYVFSFFVWDKCDEYRYKFGLQFWFDIFIYSSAIYKMFSRITF